MRFVFQPENLLSSPAGELAALLVWAVLAGTAYVDARRGRVPDLPLLGGALAVSVAMLWVQPPQMLLERGALALAVGGAIWGGNELWYRWRGQDALGMGDAKWSMLAVLAFGMMPVLWAWAIGAWLALGWMAALRLMKRKIRRVYFAPFLCVALAVVKMAEG
ncbi:MAG: hypothetical protein WBK91_09895 [Alphaproteobacteria bacterium]